MMTASLQLSALSFLSSLERMGGIETGLAAPLALQRMKDDPQSLIFPMAFPHEPPLTTLFRLHHAGFSRHALIWWENRPQPEIILKKVRIESRRREAIGVEEILRSYFSGVAASIERGGHLLMDRPSWFETYIHRSLARIKSDFEADPEATFINLAIIGALLEVENSGSQAEEIYQEARRSNRMIADSDSRDLAEDRLAVIWAELGLIERAKHYFESRLRRIQENTTDPHGKAVTIREVMRMFPLSFFPDLGDRMIDAALRMTHDVPEPYRESLQLDLLTCAGYRDKYRIPVDQLIESSHNSDDPQAMGALVFFLADFGSIELKKKSLHLFEHATALARKIRNPSTRAEALADIADSASEVFPKRARKLFREAVGTVGKIRSLRGRRDAFEYIRNLYPTDKKPIFIPDLDLN